MSPKYETEIANEQDLGEFQDYLHLLQREKVRRYLEIGSRYGCTLWRAARAMPKGSTIISIDLPGADGGDGDSEDSLHQCRQMLIAQGFEVSLIRANSKNPNAIALAKELAPFDAVFIDGDHTATGVWSDWENYGPLAPIVAFHDIACRGEITKVWAKWLRYREAGNHIGPFPSAHRVWRYLDDEHICPVPYLWDELKAVYPRHQEFIRAPGTFGIGVLWR